MRRRATHPNGRKKRTITLFAAALLLLLGAALAYGTQQRSEEKTQNQEIPQLTQPSVQDTSGVVTGRYLFTGTIVPARGVEQQAQRADGTYDFYQPFSQLDTLNPEAYDAWVTDLECPITDVDMTFRQQVETLIFNCRTGFLDPIVEYFEFINLANNHSGDQGRASFIETQDRLDQAGAQIFGHYDPTETQDICEVVGLPVRIIRDNAPEENGRLPVALCAWHYFTSTPTRQQLDVMNEYASVMPVFAFTHAGIEYTASAQPSEVELARSLIDRGAEFVINNNPHWVQNTEVYNNRLIVYSTGNFMFDQLDTETNRAANLDVTIEVDHSESTAEWLTLGASCIGRGDTCLQAAKEGGLEKPLLSYTFDVVASLNGYRELTRKADASTQAAIEERMNWAQTLVELGQAQ